MLRERLQRHGTQADPEFRWRGGEVSRIEALSDGVFAIAIALLALAGSIPKNYGELMYWLRELPAFGVCLLFMLWVWWHHYKFFRRYGLEDMWTYVLNGALLFAVLTFVFPLRFLGTVLITSPLFGPKYGWVYDASGKAVSLGRMGPEFMLFYGAGFTAIFFVLFFMNYNAWRRREDFELDEIEQSLTKVELRAHATSLGVGVVALGFAVAGEAQLSGFTFMATGPVHGVQAYFAHGSHSKVQKRVRGDEG